MIKKSPLTGRKIIVTRAREQAADLTNRLLRLGAEVTEAPTIEVRSTDPSEIDRAIGQLGRYDWIFFTSSNGVKFFFDRLRAAEADPGSLPSVCTIGPATAREVTQAGGRVELQPELYQAEGVIEEFTRLYRGGLSGLRILIPRARIAREILPESLQMRGARVDVIPVYETVAPEESGALIQEVLRDGNFDLVTFTSSSTVRNFAELAGDALPFSCVPCAVIGPITGETAREFGFSIICQPDEFTIPALVKAIATHFSDTEKTEGS